jgi:hypothetical protein
VCHSFGEFLLKLHAEQLSHEAVIEIMIALLGAMIAILTLMSALLAVGIAVVGVLGYQTIRDEAARKAESIAKRVAKTTATRIANTIRQQVAEEAQASGLSEGQAENLEAIRPQETTSATGPKRRRARTDKSLKEGGE